MGTTTLQISFGEEYMRHLAKWREKEEFPPEATNDAFVRAMVLRAMAEAIGEE